MHSASNWLTMLRRSEHFTISGGSCLIGALALLILPLRFLTAALLAAAVHELCHCAAITLCGGHVTALRICVGRTVMETTPLTPGRELLCALAGPAGSFLLLFFAHRLPLTALLALVQGTFNLLPVYPLDGGRIALCTARLIGCPWAEHAAELLGYTSIAVVLAAGIYIAYTLRIDISALAAGALLLYRAMPRNNSCKTEALWVQ